MVVPLARVAVTTPVSAEMVGVLTVVWVVVSLMNVHCVDQLLPLAAK